MEVRALAHLIRGVGDILLATLRAVPVALFLLFVYGLNTSTGTVVFSSTVQGAVLDAVRGCVFTLLDVTWSLMAAPFGGARWPPDGPHLHPGRLLGGRRAALLRRYD
ncbi:MAG TPA: hypothetical protein VFU88_21045 [Ktedonobacterales bacterium]|nr:hypothetical protein [Ktedonobacterales bacterium]